MPEDKNKSNENIEPGAQNQDSDKFEPFDNLSPHLRRRRPAWASSYTALKYISALPRENFRKSDKITDVLVLVCVLFAAMLIFFPPNLLKSPIILLADFAFVAIIISFIMKRLGILITLSQRQAVLVWDIVVGSLLLGVLLTFNMMLFILYMTRSPL